MKIRKIVFWLRVILLTIVCIQLAIAKLFIESGLIALFILYDLTKSKVNHLELRLDKLEKEKNER